MKRLLISTTCFSMVLTSGPLPLAAQTVLQIGEQEVICLPNKKTECPEGAFCVVAKREKNCEARAMEALGLAVEGVTEPEADAEAAVDGGDAAAVDAEAAAVAAQLEAEAAATAEAATAADAEQAAAEAEAAAAAEAAATAQAEAEAAAAQAAQDSADAEAAAAAEAALAEAEAAAVAAQAAQAAADAEATAAAAAQADAEAAAAAQMEAEAAAKAQADADAAAQADADAAAQADADAAAQADAEAAAQADADAAAQADGEAAAQADAEAAAAVEADAAVAAEGDAVVATEPAPEVEVIAPMTDAEAAAVLETAEGIEAPKAEAIDALTDILAADRAGQEVTIDALPEAAAAAAEEGPDLTNPEEQDAAPADGTAAAADTAEPPVKKRRKPRAVVTEVTEEQTRRSDQDFDEQANATEIARDGDGKKRLSDLEKFGLVVIGALVVGSLLKNGDKVVSNTGDRVVVQQPDGTYVVLKDDDTLIRRPGSSVQTETYDDGSTRSTVLYTDGSRIVTIRDAAGRVLRRARIDSEGRQTLLIDDLAPVERIDVSTLPRTQGRVIRADEQDAELRAALLAEESRNIGRSFSLRQVREYTEVRALAPTIDVAAITFDTGSAAIRASEARKLSKLGELMADMVRENPSEVFLIEGHTDAVGSGAYNLALSDRRAESLALALTEYYAVPPENMVIQGYGERELLVDTAGDEPRNRRTAVRVISGLLDRTAQR